MTCNKRSTVHSKIDIIKHVYTQVSCLNNIDNMSQSYCIDVPSKGDNTIYGTPLCGEHITCKNSGRGKPTIITLYSSPGNVSTLCNQRVLILILTNILMVNVPITGLSLFHRKIYRSFSVAIIIVFIRVILTLGM